MPLMSMLFAWSTVTALGNFLCNCDASALICAFSGLKNLILLSPW
jgi:hypothetical protein